MTALRHDFLPEHFESLLLENGIDGSIAVQADQSEEETQFLLNLASKNPFIKGVVGWVNLAANDIEERLEYWSGYEKLKGFRHIVQAEPDDNFLLNKNFCRGISCLERFGFTYDILVFPRHLPNVVSFVEMFPRQPFVINHLAKPAIKKGEIEQWAKQLKRLAENPKVYCKLSGLVTEGDLHNWKSDDFRPYIDMAIECFGTERLMFGSDWPVCLLGASYGEAYMIVEENTSHLTNLEKDRLWGLNAKEFYNLQA